MLFSADHEQTWLATHLQDCRHNTFCTIVLFQIMTEVTILYLQVTWAQCLHARVCEVPVSILWCARNDTSTAVCIVILVLIYFYALFIRSLTL